MKKHTPGPWTRKFGNSVYQGTDPHNTGQLVAVCYPTIGTIEELQPTFANTQLIAAAPDLLEALEAMYDKYYMEGYAAGSPLDKALTAINKAKGATKP